MGSGMDRDQALRIVDSLYAAALGEAGWPEALALVADGLESSAATLEIHDVTKGKLLSFDSARLDPSTIPVYIRDFVWRNPRTAFLKRAGDILSFDHLFMTESEMDQDPFYAEFLAPSSLRYFIAAQTPLLEGHVKGVLAVQRSGRVRGVAMEHVGAMRVLEPTVNRAVKLYWTRMRHAIDPDYLDCALARHGLTPAERRLAASVAFGEPLADYARRTGLSINTVYTHYRRTKDKMGFAKQAELVAGLREIVRPSPPPASDQPHQPQ